MIILVAASAVALAGLQASINAPRDSFRACLRTASEKALGEKIGSDAIDGYLKNACSGQLASLRGALVAFDVKNGMAHAAADKDANMTVDDYMSGPIDHYKFAVAQNAPANAAQQASVSTPVKATPASVSTPPKP